MSNFAFIENYIYLYHLDKFLLIPTYPESISDTSTATFSSTNSIARSAPVYSYSHSGPRTVQVNLKLHREMMQQLNYSNSNIRIEELDLGESNTVTDYVDFLVKQLQTIALPKYSATDKMVDPPLIALRFGNEIYIKGVVDGGVTTHYSGPILNNNKYAMVEISFQVHEVDPYDAESI